MLTPKFKSGDRVRCISDPTNGYLHIGQIYTINKHYPDYAEERIRYSVQEIFDSNAQFLEERFEFESCNPVALIPAGNLDMSGEVF